MKAVSHPKRKLSIKREIIKKKLLNIKSIGERYNNKNEQKKITRKTQKQILSGKKKQSVNLNDLNAGQWRLPNLIEKKKINRNSETYGTSTYT